MDRTIVRRFDPNRYLVEKSKPRFRIGHLYEVFAVPMPRPPAAGRIAFEIFLGQLPGCRALFGELLANEGVSGHGGVPAQLSRGMPRHRAGPLGKGCVTFAEVR